MPILLAMTNLSSPEEIVTLANLAKQCLSSILNESGTILYSSHKTLKPGRYYFLGLNPGGATGRTVQESLSLLGTSTENAYLDQEWGSESRSYDRGKHGFENNYRFLFEALQENPEDVCASNLIFKRSGGERGSGYPELAKICWPVHEAIIEIVRPSAIITCGLLSFEFVAQKLGGGSIVKHPSGQGKWKWQSLLREGTPCLIGLPHLSRYALRNHPEVMEDIRQLIG